MPFPYYKQLNAMDCGPTCLRMVAKYYGRHYNADTLRQKTGFAKQGVSLLGISETAEKLGFRTRGVKIGYSQLEAVTTPAILHWDQNHFVVLVDISSKKVKIADPGNGMLNFTKDEFLNHWISSNSQDELQTGIALLMEPTPTFFESDGEKESKITWHLLFRYLAQSKSQILQVLIAFVITSLLQLIFPFLTQSIVDTGINTQNLQYVVIVLVAQMMLTFSQTVVAFIRSTLLLRISNILNLQILSDFWIKLTKLPVAYFDVHHTGDTMQRISDHNTIKDFLTGTVLSTLFSFFNFVVYAIVLVMYNLGLFIVFIIGSLIYFAWVLLFMRMRRKINYQTFHLSAKENNATLQLIQGMQEIRLNNAERQKRWDWENTQASIFKLNFKSLNYSQLQSIGATLINQLQNIAISFLVSKLVIEGRLTLGAMLAIQYIIGQLSGPISQWVVLIQNMQDAKISMERLNEIHQLSDEENSDKFYISQLSTSKSISISDLSYAYPGAGNEPVLEDISLFIPEGKVTAIVGVSGSGKTTLLKILLKVYEQYSGVIRIGANEPKQDLDTDKNTDGLRFDNIRHSYWRSICGAVMQDGYIFNDTIARNIAVGQEEIEYERLIQSCRTSNIYSFIESLPNGFYTLLGSEGVGLSQGQKQRLLIARAVYKDPEYLFFDEATNSLDANNEREIVGNLSRVFKEKTVVVVAHRLSTVKSADKIVVLDKGKIVEEGTHEQLTLAKGKYYQLVKNQLEMGN
ncbi:peptidase domain-containing ABC transporter [Mucilaginibacter sp. SJ]|uniref:peptidase domain-containing ABC transporter n=1 Tax=Mucilaginibacter sp. SJ TaxID=3029053 RepID=UPI0023A97457|nr:peptidase domain-containing ABC transporter [Mucilaginibacter sp. SJ]WEA01828.1 peptidase domain-containing ABC transporter [Mucilaginibacter sp. SJ]